MMAHCASQFATNTPSITSTAGCSAELDRYYGRQGDLPALLTLDHSAKRTVTDDPLYQPNDI